MPNYDAAFFKYVNAGAVSSAQRLLPVLLREIRIRSVLDVGCGAGAWLTVWRSLGVEVVGIDGHYVDMDQLLIPATSFIAHDLTQDFSLGRCFDLVQSLEVAEHLPEQNAESFVACLVRHGDLILFSAAVKGQGGHHHINEQSYEYWRVQFARHGYVAIDYLRPLLIGKRDVEPWYRYNTLLFVTAERFHSLPESIRIALIPANQPVRDLSPPLYRIRKAIVRIIPAPIVTGIAKAKERIIVSATSLKSGGEA